MSMGTGARSTDQWREHRALLEAISRNNAHAEVPAAPAPAASEPAPPKARWRELVLAGVLVALGGLWLAAVITSVQANAAPLTRLAQIVSMASGPLALLG